MRPLLNRSRCELSDIAVDFRLTIVMAYDQQWNACINILNSFTLKYNRPPSDAACLQSVNCKSEFSTGDSAGSQCTSSILMGRLPNFDKWHFRMRSILPIRMRILPTRYRYRQSRAIASRWTCSSATDTNSKNRNPNQIKRFICEWVNWKFFSQLSIEWNIGSVRLTWDSDFTNTPVLKMWHTVSLLKLI